MMAWKCFSVSASIARPVRLGRLGDERRRGGDCEQQDQRFSHAHILLGSGGSAAVSAGAAQGRAVSPVRRSPLAGQISLGGTGRWKRYRAPPWPPFDLSASNLRRLGRTLRHERHRPALRADARAGRRSIRRERIPPGGAERVCPGQGNQRRGDGQVTGRQHQWSRERRSGGRPPICPGVTSDRRYPPVVNSISREISMRSSARPCSAWR